MDECPDRLSTLAVRIARQFASFRETTGTMTSGLGWRIAAKAASGAAFGKWTLAWVPNARGMRDGGSVNSREAVMTPGLARSDATCINAWTGPHTLEECVGRTTSSFWNTYGPVLRLDRTARTSDVTARVARLHATAPKYPERISARREGSGCHSERAGHE
jgi:hypothetical protein